MHRVDALIQAHVVFFPGTNRERSTKAVYRHPDYLTYTQSTSCKMPDWMKHKLESRLPSFKTKERHRVSNRDVSGLMDGRSYVFEVRSWSDIPMCAAHSRQDMAASSL